MGEPRIEAHFIIKFPFLKLSVKGPRKRAFCMEEQTCRPGIGKPGSRRVHWEKEKGVFCLENTVQRRLGSECLYPGF